MPKYRDGAFLLVHLVVNVAFEPRDDLGEFRVPLLVLLGRSRDDQRGTSFVNENGVNLVNNRVMVTALHALAERTGHIVTQVVEAKLVVRAIGDVGLIGLLAGHRRHIRQDRRDRQS